MTPDNVPTDNLDPLALSIMQEIGSTATTVSEAREDPLVKQYITDGMARANEESVSRAAKVQVRGHVTYSKESCDQWVWHVIYFTKLPYEESARQAEARTLVVEAKIFTLIFC